MYLIHRFAMNQFVQQYFKPPLKRVESSYAIRIELYSVSVSILLRVSFNISSLSGINQSEKLTLSKAYVLFSSNSFSDQVLNGDSLC
jgi:hypothetical protein